MSDQETWVNTSEALPVVDNIADKLANSRLIIIQHFPFFTSLLALIRFVPVVGLKTLACDQHARVYYDPTLSWNQQEINAVFLHEVCHLANLHFARWRFKEEDDQESKKDPTFTLNQKLTNVAGDLEINVDIYELCGAAPEIFQFPHQGGLLPAHFGCKDHLLAEDYYDLIQKQVDKEESSQQGGNKVVVLVKDSQDCGSAADGVKRDYELEVDPSTPDADTLADAAGQVNSELEDWGKEVSETGDDGEEKQVLTPQHGQQAGNEAGRLRLDVLPRLLKGRLWLDRIRKMINEHLRLKTWGYGRPNRRYQTPPFILPGKSYQTPTVSFLVDTSGSINMESAHQAFRVIDQLKRIGVQCHVVACDTEPVIVRDRKAAYGGGGTALGRGVDLITKMFPMTDVMVVITDGHNGDDWGTRPAWPTICFTWSAPGADWMKTVMMPPLC